MRQKEKVETERRMVETERKRERIRGRKEGRTIRYNNFYNSFIEDKEGGAGGGRLQVAMWILPGDGGGARVKVKQIKVSVYVFIDCRINILIHLPPPSLPFPLSFLSPPTLSDPN